MSIASAHLEHLPRSVQFTLALGLAALLLSSTTLLWLLWLWLANGAQRRPFFWAAIGLAIAGLILFLIGFIAELVVSQAEQLAEVERLVREERLAADWSRDDRGGP